MFSIKNYFTFFRYKSIQKYDFNNTNMTPPGDDAQPFTQLVWKSASKVGMAAVYREDTKTSYLVAQFTPPGNYGDVRNYWKYVTPPLAGTSKGLMELSIFQEQNFFSRSSF